MKNPLSTEITYAYINICLDYKILTVRIALSCFHLDFAK